MTKIITYNIPYVVKGKRTIQQATGRRLWVQFCGARTPVMVQEPDGALVHYSTGFLLGVKPLSDIKKLWAIEQGRGGTYRLCSDTAYVEWYLARVEARLGTDTIKSRIAQEPVINK